MPNIVRMPYKEKIINELSKDDDYVSVAGHPIVIQNDLMILDDGNSTIIVHLPENSNINQAKFIKVFGKALEINNKLNIQADFIQDISGIDTFLYNKIRSLTRI